MSFLFIFLASYALGQTAPDKLFEQCKDEFDSRKYQNCIQTCKRILDLDYDSVSNSIRDKVYEMRSQSYTNSLKILDSLITADSSKISLFLNRGEIKLDLGLIRFAFADINYFLSKDSTSNLAGKAFRLKASYYYQVGQFEKSIFLSTKSLLINPNNYKAYYTRSESYLMTMDYLNGLKDIDIFIDNNPNHSKAYTLRATLRINLYEGVKERIPSVDLEKICSDLKKGLELGNDVGHDFQKFYCAK